MTKRSTNGPVQSRHHFFFYGLLKKGATGMPAHIDLEKAGEFLNTAYLRGELYDLKGFPGLVDGDAVVTGILYRLDDAAIAPALDDFEDVIEDDLDRSLYRREWRDIVDQSGEPTGEQAWVYIYNHPPGDAPRVEGDNWPLEAGWTQMRGAEQ